MKATEPAMIGRWSSWVQAWTALSLPGVCLAILSWGPGKVLGITAAVALPAALVFIVAEHGGRQWDGHPSGRVGGWMGRVVLCAVTFVVSMAAVTALVPGAALLLLGLAGATTPPANDLRRRMLGQATAVPAGTHPEAAERITSLQPPFRAAEAAREMTEAELCRAWRRSFWTLRDARDPVEKLTVVLQRQSFLDELEARNARALGAWLASGARPSGGPERFLHDDGGGGGKQSAAA